MAGADLDFRATYADFNARNVDAVLARMTEDVEWPNGSATDARRPGMDLRYRRTTHVDDASGG